MSNSKMATVISEDENTELLNKINVVLTKFNGLLCSKSSIDIEFDALKFQRNQGSTIEAEIQAFQETNWLEKCARNSRLYNASKFRLASFTCLESRSRIGIQVGITSYKELLGTHHFGKAEQLLNESYDNFFKGLDGFPDEYAFMSNCLGVGAIALTTDDFVILMKRAKWTGEAPEKIDRPGGHPEPDLVLKPDSKPTNEQVDYENYKDLEPNAVLEEIFASPQNELRDEINVPLECQDEPKLLGLIRDMELGGRCAFDFLIGVQLTRQQVEQK